MKKYVRTVITVLLCCICTLQISSANDIKKVYYKNGEKTKQIALTFDDGPHPRYTPQIINILKEYNVTATFFVIGVNATLYSDALNEIVKYGCEIGNHTFTHKNLKSSSKQDVIEELSKCEKSIADNFAFETKNVSKLFRPPQGSYNPEVESAATEMGYDIILWSIDTEDWAHTPSEIIAKKVLASLKDGDIILMHDYVSGKNTTCEALRILIPAILERGYEFVTVSELINGATA